MYALSISVRTKPLLLLWKGIGQFVLQYPHYRVLFGPVSISASYSPVSRTLIASFLEQRRMHAGLASFVSAVRPFTVADVEAVLLTNTSAETGRRSTCLGTMHVSSPRLPPREGSTHLLHEVRPS